MTGIARSNLLAGIALTSAKLFSITSIVWLLTGHRYIAAVMLASAAALLVASIWLSIKTLYSREYLEDTSWNVGS